MKYGRGYRFYHPIVEHQPKPAAINTTCAILVALSFSFVVFAMWVGWSV